MAPIICWVLLCATLWGKAAWRIANGQSIIRFEPRRPAPWARQFAIVMAALLILGGLFAAVSFAVGEPTDLDAQVENVEQGSPEDADSAKLVKAMLFGSLIQLILVGGLLFALQVTSGAGASDFGLDFRRLGYDIRIGLAAFVAMSVPTYGLQYLAVKFVKDASHPLIDALATNSSPFVLLSSIVLTVIVAPIAEEIIFRVLLQGFFETLLVKLRIRRSPEVSLREAPIGESDRFAEEEIVAASDEVETFRAAPAWTGPEPANEPLVETSPGVIPILFSAALFALAHMKYGPSAIPLFFFGLALGYLYQQTHRLLPSVVLHMSLNGTTMFALVVKSLTDP